MNPLPVQPAKLHCPPHRSDTLSRARLNDWLERATKGRLGLIIAEAGFGKTTLLGDWARQTRRLTTWYRLESDDRDWLTFVRHLVAGGRELDPEFAPETFALLMALGTGEPTQEEIAASVARELADFAARAEHGLTLLIDDYHHVDGFAETERIVKALLERTGNGFSMVLASRSAPHLPLSRLRARGGVMTLTSRDLRFDESETAGLFRDAYQQPLDADLPTELCRRTQGWAALLGLVGARMSEAGDTRALVARLNANSGDLYDFLAEEVMSSLAADLVAFLTQVSVLLQVREMPAALLTRLAVHEVRDLVGEAERLGLLTRHDRNEPHVFHPLVREFLLGRLSGAVGDDAISQMHLQVARALELTDWHSSAWHYRASGMHEEAARVIDGAVSRILGSGRFEEAREFLDGSAGNLDRPGALVLRSRLELERGHREKALQLAEAAAEAAAEGPLQGLAMLNLTAIHAQHGFAPSSVAFAAQALGSPLESSERHVAEATVVVSATQDEGHLPTAADYLRGLAQSQDAAGQRRYAAITRLNLAGILLWLGDVEEAEQTAARAEADLPQGSVERAAATAARVSAAVLLGRTDELDALRQVVAHAPQTAARDEAAIELARILGDYGDLTDAAQVLSQATPAARTGGYSGPYGAIAATLALRRSDVDGAAAEVEGIGTLSILDAVGRFRVEFLRGRAEVARGVAPAHLAEASRLADVQGSELCRSMVQLLQAIAADRASDGIVSLPRKHRHLTSMLAEELTKALPGLSVAAAQTLDAEIRGRPDRWRSALRLAFASDPVAARLLTHIGNADDAMAMRSAAVTQKWLRPLAAALTRSIAPRLLVEDLGVVRLSLGGRPLQRSIRRKVVSLLCFLATRPGLAATRDEVLEAIWPDLSPDTGINSLHQTIYYLRRVLEPDYREGLGAGYIAFDGEVISLDQELVDFSSRQVWRLVAEAREGSIEAVTRLATAYPARFALDFAYEDWAAPHRETLHAAVLEAAERGIEMAVVGGVPHRAIAIAQSLLSVDPHADGIELALLRAYKAAGRHAAAAEQYAHYAAYVRGELGEEPAPFSEL